MRSHTIYTSNTCLFCLIQSGDDDEREYNGENKGGEANDQPTEEGGDGGNETAVVEETTVATNEEATPINHPTTQPPSIQELPIKEVLPTQSFNMRSIRELTKTAEMAEVCM